MKLPEIKVALSVEFLDAFAAIPRRQQAQVRRFIEEFRRNPTASTYNYEVIRNAPDRNLRSVRIDGAYRAIVLKPEKGNVYGLLWVANHDDAYEWASRRRIRIDPATGGLQVLVMNSEVEPAPEPMTPAPATQALEDIAPEPTLESTQELQDKAPTRGLFDDHDDAGLLRFGLPEEWLAAVRALKTESELDALQPNLPDEVYEALFLLAAGYSPDEAWEQVAGTLDRPKEVDTDDFAAAFANPQTLRRFAVVESDAELAAILNAPLARWRVFLHPSQRQLVTRKASGPMRVLGGAGTGKTVVAMHRARHLAEHVFAGKDDRILFTTFTRNLATDIAENLSQLCSGEVRSRIEVVSFDHWVRDFLHREGFDYTLTYDDRAAADKAWKLALSLAEAASGLSAEFYREELDKVVLPQGIVDQAGYFKASRAGRGTPLGRKERAAVWPVFEEYRKQLSAARLIEPADAMREARRRLEAKGNVLPYRAVVVDEAQDLGAQAFMLLRQVVPTGPDDMFIVGDAHQRIYGQQVVLSRCGVQVRGRSVRLKINYRTTDEIRRWAVSLLSGQPIDDLDGESDEIRGYKSLLHGELPEVVNVPTAEAELDVIVAHLKRAEGEPGGLPATCMVARTNALVEEYRQALEARGIAAFVLKDKGDDPSKPGVRLATMHRVKGLEFERMVIVGVNDGVMPLALTLRTASDETMRAERELAERSLLYVAATRAKRHVVITSHGKPSPFLLDSEEITTMSLSQK